MYAAFCTSKKYSFEIVVRTNLAYEQSSHFYETRCPLVSLQSSYLFFCIFLKTPTLRTSSLVYQLKVALVQQFGHKRVISMSKQTIALYIFFILYIFIQVSIRVVLYRHMVVIFHAFAQNSRRNQEDGGS